MKTITHSGALKIGFVGIFAYFSVWLSFTVLTFSGNDIESASSFSRIITGILFAPGYLLYLVSLPLQFITQSILTLFTLTRDDVFGVITYSRWLIYLMTSINTAFIAGLLLASRERKTR